jgi:integrase
MTQPTNRRRAKGEGGLFYDEHAQAWVATVELAPGPDGKRRRRKVKAKTKTAVAAKLRDLRKAEAQGVDIGGRSPTVAELAEGWLAKAAPARKAPSTLTRISSIVRRDIIPTLGHHRVDKLRPEQVEDWLAAEAAKGKAKRTLEGYRLTLAEIIGWAEKRRLVSWNVARLADLPQTARPPTEKRSLTEQEAPRLLDALDGERLGPYFATLLLLGLRPGEADALKWSAVDFDAATVAIEAAMQRGDGGRPLGIGPTKTKQMRVLTMPASVVAMLRQQRVRQAEERLRAGGYWSTEWPDLVFTTELGTPMHPSNCRRAFAAITDKAGLPRLTPYELRHSAASLLVAAGVPPFEAADLLGHSDLRMLERHYRHRLNPVVTAGPQALEALLGRNR